jgi:alpha,alpha-trehalase
MKIDKVKNCIGQVNLPSKSDSPLILEENSKYTWSLVYRGFDPQEEGLREALCTLGNGYFCTRGANIEASADDIHYPGTYLAGGYNRLKTEIAGQVIENEDLVNLPNWLPLSFRIDEGEWFDVLNVDLLSYCQELDSRRGVLLRDLRFRDKQGRQTRMAERRLVHMCNPHLAALEVTLTAENWSGRMEIRSALDGRVVNAGVERYRDLHNRHLEPLEARGAGEDSIFLKTQTNQSELRIAQAARTQIFRDNQPLPVRRQTIAEPGFVAQHLVFDLHQGDSATVEKVVTLFTSRDSAISECGLEAQQLVARADRFPRLLESHVLAWEHLWRRFSVRLQHRDPQEGGLAERVLRLHMFHLLQTTSTNTMDLDTGVPPRGWHGEAYRGHILWDELFIFPLLNLRIPEITRSLLMYRYRRLNEARVAAQQGGYRGAMYPWQSGSSGREESQVIHLNPQSGRWIPDNTRLQRHVNAAIAYTTYNYCQVTGDLEFLSFYGAEMILEIARFWASIATYNADLDRYEILGVMGPDEYHDAYPGADTPGLNNNAYTNVMAVWVLKRALELFEILPEDRSCELCEILKLQQEELDLWQDISRKMRLAFHGDGIISQFEGYGQLEEFDWEGYRKKYGNIQRLDRILEAEGDTTNRYKASKQADVLMLFYLFSSDELREIFDQLGYPFEYETIPKNIDYYLRRTSHGSTLSWVVHSWVLARSDRVGSWKLFREALKSDVCDIQGGTTAEGIHLGAMAGTVDLMKRGYTGIELRGDILRFNPCLPEELERLEMQIRYRGHTLDLTITTDRLRVSTVRAAEKPIKVAYLDKSFDLKPDEALEIPL